MTLANRSFFFLPYYYSHTQLQIPYNITVFICQKTPMQMTQTPVILSWWLTWLHSVTGTMFNSNLLEYPATRHRTLCCLLQSTALLQAASPCLDSVAEDNLLFHAMMPLLDGLKAQWPRICSGQASHAHWLQCQLGIEQQLLGVAKVPARALAFFMGFSLDVTRTLS